MSVLCEHCLEGHALVGNPTGSFEGSAYFHPASSPDSKTAVVLLTDIFGLKLVNPKLMADQYSERLNCDVWVPDYFNGKPPFDEPKMAPLFHDVPGAPSSLLHKLKFFWAIIQCLPSLIQNRASVVDQRAATFLKHIKEEKKYEKIGVVGFCYGGAMVVRLGSTDLFTSGVVAHPGPTTRAEVEAMKVPTSWICAEEDQSFGAERRAETEAIFKRKQEATKLDYEFQDYKGTVHGFAARPNLGNPDIKKAFEQSFEQTVAWFQKTLA